VPRLFVAVRPPPDLLDRIEALPRPDVAGLRWTGRRHWHVTLRFLGPVPEVDPVVEALGAAAGLLAGTTEAVLGPAVGRFGSRVLHVPVSGLERVSTAVVAATADIGHPPDDRPFRGHVTLARAAGRRASVDLRPLTGTPVTGRWPVDEICLVRSDLSPAGARYEVVATFGLPGDGPPSTASVAP